MYNAEDIHGGAFFIFDCIQRNQKLKKENELLKAQIKDKQKENDILKKRIDNQALTMNYIDGHWCEKSLDNIEDFEVKADPYRIIIKKGDVVYRDIKTHEIIAIQKNKGDLNADNI